MRYVYLHGFASSPQSRKAQAFREAFSARGLELDIPSLDRGDFEHLTLSGQLKIVEELLSGAECRLIGSSMGGYLAAIYAAAHPREVDRLVLMAPALNFVNRWREMQGREAVARWRTSGWLDVFHYGEKTMRRVHYGLLEDAGQFEAEPDFRQPALIYHGVNDAVVPVGLSRAFAARHSNAKLIEMNSDHELTDALESIVPDAVKFLTS